MSNTWQVRGVFVLFSSSLELYIFISFKIFLIECGALNGISDIIQWCLGDVFGCVSVCECYVCVHHSTILCSAEVISICSLF